MNKIVFILIFIFLTHQTHALYFIDTPEHPVKEEEIAGVNTKFPAVCKVATADSEGTGTLIAPNVVITARHVVADDSKLNTGPYYVPRDIKQMAVEFGETKYSVIQVHLPKNEELDIALLVLTENVFGIKPRQTSTVNHGDTISTITISGYGHGRAIYPEQEGKIDPTLASKLLIDTWNGDSLSCKFRFREYIQGSFKVEKDDANFTLTRLILEHRHSRAFEAEYTVEHNAYTSEYQQYSKKQSILHKEMMDAFQEFIKNTDSEDAKLRYHEASNTLRKYEATEPKEPKKPDIPKLELPDLAPPCVITATSNIFFTGKGDSGGPLLNSNGKVIGILSRSNKRADIQYAVEDEAEEITSSNMRLASCVGLGLGIFAANTAQLAYLISSSTDSSLLFSTAIGAATALTLNAIAAKTMGICAPFNFLMHHFYYKPYQDVIKKNDAEFRKLIEDKKGQVESIYMAITPDVKSWIDGVVAEARDS